MPNLDATRAVLLRRHGLLFLEPTGISSDAHVRGVELEWAELARVASPALRAVLLRQSLPELLRVSAFVLATVRTQLGADAPHTPLFARFPEDLPADTLTLWWQKVLGHFVDADEQCCPTCGSVDTTHVLQPCAHVVCERCFDGARYTACPICERHVDRSSPFFAMPPRATHVTPPLQPMRFVRLDVGADLLASTRTLVQGFCARAQPLSPTDRADFEAVVRELGVQVLPWLPDVIPLKENIALVFGVLLRAGLGMAAWQAATPYLKTATDVLRLLVAWSGKDPGLPGEYQATSAAFDAQPQRFFGAAARSLEAARQGGGTSTQMTIHTRRIGRLRIARPLRRAVLAQLEALAGAQGDTLVEDMMRHRAWWVSVGEALHPGEHAARLPLVARGFAQVRTKAVDGTPAPPFASYARRVELARGGVEGRDGDVASLIALLSARPGEFGRRLDDVLRARHAQPAAQHAIAQAFLDVVPHLTTPLLLTLRAHLPRRDRKAPVRVFFPKESVARAPSSDDPRPTLPADIIAPLVRALDAELLQRLSTRPAWQDARARDFVVDAALADHVVPFAERSASPSAIALTRGSRVQVPLERVVRVFLHWCEPERGGHTTDLDLSLAFYGEAWQHTGVCSYYQLELHAPDGIVARSSGDLRDAPFPDGASEFVDIDIDRARRAGHRYAVLVVNNYAGMPFGQLHRAFAGLMLRDSFDGAHFDPTSVALKFALSGDNGVFMPLVLDLQDRTLHWLDVHAVGQPVMNNVATSNRAIATVCPALITYFATGTRPDQLSLALLHAAARARRVHVRGRDGRISTWERRPDESAAALWQRLRDGPPDARGDALPDFDAPVCAALLHGDVALPTGSAVHAIFPGVVHATIAPADLVASSPAPLSAPLPAGKVP